MHKTYKKGLQAGELFTDRTIDEAYRIYYDEILYCVKNFKQYNILGHLELVKRYTIDNRSTHHFREIISEIFKVIIPDRNGIELNTSGTCHGLPSGMPSKSILQLNRT